MHPDKWGTAHLKPEKFWHTRAPLYKTEKSFLTRPPCDTPVNKLQVMPRSSI